MNEVICPYKDKCTSCPYYCDGCVNNTGRRNYYKPDIDFSPHEPHSVPSYPHYDISHIGDPLPGMPGYIGNT